MAKIFASMDGNQATAHVAYMFSEVAGIYPITPSSTMAEYVDAWMTQGRKNIFNSEVKVIEMQSEAGAAGVVHGALQAGALATTFTASQGLLLMIPNIYKWSGEFLPGVIHVAARSIATRALSIFGDHQDIYACRQAGIAMISSHSVQEAMDLAGVAHLAAIKASVPFMHFFDGFRTSHEIQKIEVMDQKYLESLMDTTALEAYRARGLDPHNNVITRGGAENDDVYFQGREAQNTHFSKVADIVAEYMAEISKQTGREYAPFTYYGAKDATDVIIAMGSVTETTKEVVDHLLEDGRKVGLIKVHLYRPFAVDYLTKVLPATVKRIAVLDRTKEVGSREPLYLDVYQALKGYGQIETIIGGRYGLSSKDTQPRDVKAVYDNLMAAKPIDGFTISIVDDVTNLSLPADFISCTLEASLLKYDMLRNLKNGGTFLLNTTFKPETIEQYLPNRVKRQLARKKAKFYIIDATEIADGIGMSGRTNTILQASFFALNEQIMPYKDAVAYMKEAAKKTYSKKGDEIVELNYKAIDSGKDGLVEITVKPEWAEVPAAKTRLTYGDDYLDNHVLAMNSLEGYDLPVSHFVNQGILDGSMRNNVSFYEKRTIATKVPTWHSENCIQCGFCSFVCPHATIRTFLLNDEEVANAPMTFDTLTPMGQGDVTKLHFTVSISPDNCVGCGLCSVECPGKKGEKALTMEDVKTQLPKAPLADYLFKHTEYKSTYFPTDTIKGSQFLKPYFEVSGACAGCGETPYYRLASQLFGKDMLIANATGCTSIYCGSTPSTPFVKDEDGNGIAWANSLFEDNAEFGFGMRIAKDFKANRIVENLLADMSIYTAEEKAVVEEYVANKGNREVEKRLAKAIEALIDAKIPALATDKRDIVSQSVWIIGGDGWAYDIGYGGLDHVIANNLNVNIMVLDTEVYSNTGGQSSKSSQAASIAKFAAGGKKLAKKDLGQIAMAYGHVYVASIAMGANRMQTIKALKEAEAYDGPSLILAYSPCMEHGIKGGLSNHQKVQKAAVECGYWPLYRFNPLAEKQLTIDFTTPDFEKFNDFLMNETRFSMLSTVNTHAEELMFKTRTDAEKRWSRLTKLV